MDSEKLRLMELKYTFVETFKIAKNVLYRWSVILLENCKENFGKLTNGKHTRGRYSY